MDEFEKAVSELKIKDVIVGSILTALGVLVALTWKDAIQATITYFIPSGKGLFYSYLAATIITTVAISIGYLLIRVQRLNLELLYVLGKNKKEYVVVKKKMKVSGKYD